MRRRARDLQEDPAAPPLRLQRFDRADWPDAECHPECAFWAAIGAWQATFPDGELPVTAWQGPDAPWHPEWL